MVWHSGWNNIFKSRSWGRYPSEELVRFTGRRFFSHPDRASVRILEIGCGPGANVWFLAREGFTVTGLDGSAAAVKICAERMAEEGLKAEVLTGDAFDLPFDDGAFDCVIDVECLSTNVYDDAKKMIAEAHRVSAPGGVMFSQTFAAGTVGNAPPVPLVGHDHTYTEMPGLFPPENGVTRLTPEDAIAGLYGVFDSVTYDVLERTTLGGSRIAREWIIVAEKTGR